MDLPERKLHLNRLSNLLARLWELNESCAFETEEGVGKMKEICKDITDIFHAFGRGVYFSFKKGERITVIHYPLGPQTLDTDPDFLEFLKENKMTLEDGNKKNKGVN